MDAIPFRRRLLAATPVVFAAMLAAALAQADSVVATVNGTPIYYSQVMRAKGRLPAPLQESPDSVTLPKLVPLIVEQRLLALDARSKGLDSDPEVRAQIAFVEEMVLEQAAVHRYLNTHLTDRLLRERYERLVGNRVLRDQVRARHILVETEAVAKAAIVDLLAGADFATLAREISIDPTKQDGGNLGYFNRSEMIPQFAEAAFALKPGEFSKVPVHTEYGWHVIKVEDRRMLPAPKFQEAEPQLRAELTRELRSAYAEELRKKAEIVPFFAETPPPDPAIAPAPDTKTGPGAASAPPARGNPKPAPPPAR
jgi:peptidyl-prolyl cis-trans isomerase C